MVTEVRFNEFIAFVPTVTILRVTSKHGFYLVEHYARRPAQTDLFGEPSPKLPTEDLAVPPRFTFITDHIGCEKRALSWGRRK